jgi:antitoxin HicB
MSNNQMGVRRKSVATPRHSQRVITKALTRRSKAAYYRPVKQYTVSDGKIVLRLQAAKEGGYVVTSPLEPQLITEAETVEEAFENARDALTALAASRRKLIRKLSRAKA